MATQLTLVERAKQGEPDAIAQLMNRTPLTSALSMCKSGDAASTDC